MGIAGSSGSGKSTLSRAIVSALNLPWVVILSMVAYSKSKSGNCMLTIQLGFLLQDTKSRTVRKGIPK